MKLNKKTKIFFLVAIALIQVFGINYLIFSTITKKAVATIDEKNNILLLSIENLKSEKEKLFSIDYKDYAYLFNKNYNINDAIFYSDSTISFFLYRRRIKVANVYSNYYDCLTQKCKSEIVLIKSKNTIDSLLTKLKTQYGALTNTCYNLLDTSIFFIKDTNTIYCNSIFKDFIPYTINKVALEEFKVLLKKYREDSISVAKISNRNISSYQQSFNSLKRLNIANISSIAQDKASAYIMISETFQTFNFESDVLGYVTYTFPLKTFNEEKFYAVMDEILEDQYRFNSLANGAQPYAYCFGRNKSCSGWGCSQIKVIASSNSDVLVTIKNSSGAVVRHAYIKAGYSYTFELPNGQYQPFFYYGTGWHPKKLMKQTVCGNLYGGFIANEQVEKDNYQHLYNQVLTYTLIQQINGNFNTKPSSKNEAF